ncbi:MAG: alpha/beta hydrolase [Chloroflexota bacterium]|nr:alpha/beta hydrolase [Chloroflexota bacterium]
MAVETNRQPEPPASPPNLGAFHAETTARSKALRELTRHEQGIAFGANSRQLLDIYYPKNAIGIAPVHVFLHGGGFRQGSQTTVGYMGEALVKHGAIFVAMSYRLLPDVLFPDMVVDVELGLGWVYQNIAARGGDPNRLYLSGHSAGATLAALAGLRNGWTGERGLPSNVIKGLVLISGMYDYSERPSETVNRRSKRYVSNLVQAIDYLPERTIIAAAENDLARVMPDSKALFEELQGRGAAADFVTVAGVDHFYAGHSLAEASGEIFQRTKQMMRLS